MNDQQWEQLAIDMGRLADAIEIIAKHLAPEESKSLGRHKLPNLRRPLADYASFDWTTIGAKIVATDRSGPTEVEYRGVVCKRRSGEDKKGKAIWFNVVTGGTVAEGNITYERLISFRDGTPAEPLGDKVGAIVDKARQVASQPAPGPVWPAIEHGSAIAVPVGAIAPLQPSLYDQLVTAHSEVLRMCNTVPIQYQVERTDKPADMQRKLDGLRAILANKDCGQVERTPEERAAYAKVCKEHADLIQWAEQHKVEIPPLQRIQPADDPAHIEMKISTLSKLIAPSKAAAAGMRSELDKSRQSAPAQPTQPDLLKGQTMTPDQVRAWISQRVKRGDPTRYNNTRERGQAIEAINAVTDGKASHIVRKLFNAEVDQLNSAQTLAVFEWIKPAKQTPAGQPPTMMPANIHAAAELAALLRETQ